MLLSLILLKSFGLVVSGGKLASFKQIKNERTRRSSLPVYCGVFSIPTNPSNGSVIINLDNITRYDVDTVVSYIIVHLNYNHGGNIQYFPINPNEMDCGSSLFPSDIRGYICIEKSTGEIKATSTYQFLQGSSTAVGIQIRGLDHNNTQTSENCEIMFSVTAPVVTSTTLTPTTITTTPVATSTTLTPTTNTTAPVATSATLTPTTITTMSATPTNNTYTTTSPSCQNEKAIGKKTKKVFAWPRTSIEGTAKVQCSEVENNMAERRCNKEFQNTGRWGEVDDSKCGLTQEQRALQLNSLGETVIGSNNASMVSEQLLNLTSQHAVPLNSSELVDVTNVLENLAAITNADLKVWNDVLSVVDNFLNTSKDVIQQAQQLSNTSSRLLRILGVVGEALTSNTSIPFSVTKNEFALAVTQESLKGFSGISVIYKTTNLQQTNEIQIIRNYSNKLKENEDISVYLPPSITGRLKSPGNSTLKLVFLVYNTAVLFQGKGINKVNSKVMSAEVRNETPNNLSRPVVLKYKTLTRGNSRCSWWDFSKSGGKGGWSSDGCTLYKSEAENVICHCNHLTNFAVLFGADQTAISSEHVKALSILTYIGCAISLAGTMITFVTYLFSPKLRDSQPPKILINLCVAYGCMLIIFMIGATRTDPKAGCKAVAALIQYFLLSVFAWSAVEAFYSYRGIVKPMETEIRKFIWKAMALAWGIPVTFVAIGIGIWTENYGDTQSCVVKEMPFYITLVSPAVLILILNVSSFVSIMFTLKQSSQKYSHNAMKFRDRLRVISAFIMLFGLTWIFGFLVISNDVLAFQYIFCILCSLQGFFIFVFYCVRSENVRKRWSEKLPIYKLRTRVDTAGTVGTYVQ